MTMKIRKCRRCGAEVSDVELHMLGALMAVELEAVIDEAVAELGVTREDAYNKLIMPMLRETTVCVKCFQSVNASIPLKEFMETGAFDHTPCFEWKQMRLEVLDA